MIKAAITGAETPDGGELIRLLAMHPDVEIVCASAQGLEGKQISAHHHGLIGETSLTFCTMVDASKCDVIFVCGESMNSATFEKLRIDYPNVKVIIVGHIPGVDAERWGVVFGLPEINRKALVRGATAAQVPNPFASMALTALYPLALHALLSKQIDISLSAPQNVIAENDIKEAKREIYTEVLLAEPGFTGEVELKSEVSTSRRSALMQISLDCGVTLEQLLQLYEMYDDHHFAFVTTRPVGVSEVAGTNKCVISLGRPEAGKLAIGVAADCRLRGAAGEAVHIMNLMFGLHEKTGLHLKAIDFEPI